MSPTKLLWYNSGMPEVSRFYGIIIRMYFDEHNPPHFHAQYGDENALIGIDPARLLEGNLPRRALELILDWAELHQTELMQNWNLLQQEGMFHKIAPLR
jgi:hypothetical protein